MCTLEMQNAKEKGYLDKIFRILKMRENVKVIDKDSRFNQT